MTWPSAETSSTADADLGELRRGVEALGDVEVDPQQTRRVLGDLALELAQVVSGSRAPVLGPSWAQVGLGGGRQEQCRPVVGVQTAPELVGAGSDLFDRGVGVAARRQTEAVVGLVEAQEERAGGEREQPQAERAAHDQSTGPPCRVAREGVEPCHPRDDEGNEHGCEEPGVEIGETHRGAGGDQRHEVEGDEQQDRREELSRARRPRACAVVGRRPPTTRPDRRAPRAR
ncbi:MAG: hypothetical protein U5R31_13140 [Acidimicrobiia bacterium]|nr:hypothetical protein [Acidimicrobiia bacterium]